MAKVWVLDTETKGTGAQMVPLEQVQRRPARRAEPLHVPRKHRPLPAPEPEPPQPRRFRVVDVMTREVLADDADTRATLDVLGDVRSIVDVRVSVWQPQKERWRLLTLPEQRALWRRRGGQSSAA
jgi:hypothetical protein